MLITDKNNKQLNKVLQSNYVINRFSIKNRFSNLWHNSWDEDEDFQTLSLRQQINDRKLSYDLNPQYRKIVSKFNHGLIIQYFNNLQETQVIIKKIDNSKTEDLYRNYINFVAEFRILVSEGKSQGKSKNKKFLSLIKEFNDIVGHTVVWPIILQRRTKKIQQLQRFGRKVVPTRRMLIKLRFLIDKLFRWLYKLPKARLYFGKRIISKSFDYTPRTQILHRKNLRISLGSIV